MSELIKNYGKIQERHSDAFVLLRLGDFYEIMGAKAKEAAELLDLTLTSRSGVSMVGFPAHVAEQYTKKLLEHGAVITVDDINGKPKRVEPCKPLNDHNARAHALLSASSAHRWLTCPPSAVAAEAYPNQETEFTKEGTLAHEVAECMARNGGSFGVGDPLFAEKTHDITTEMIDCAGEYCDYIQEHKPDNNALVLLEQRVDFSPWVADGFGTCDCIIVHGDTLTVIDYKYGQGVAVSAKDNPQMKLYALGALNDFGFAYDVKKVEMHIFQPRINNISDDSLTVDELMDWAEKTVKPIAQKAAKGKGTYNAGEHCKFCPHAGRCRTLQKVCTEYVETHSLRVAVPVLAPHEVADVLKMEPLITLWLKRVKDLAMTTMLNGEEVPGFKVVEGRQGLRKWTNEVEVANHLQAEGYRLEDITETKLLSPAAMDKLLGKKRATELLADFIDRAQGSPVIAPDSDKRPPYNRLEEAQKDFE